MITILYAHPYSKRSVAGKALQAAVHNLAHVQVRNLYELYPDFHIDVETEQEHLAKTQTLVLLHPLYWYHSPALLSLWFEKVLAYGWAFGLNLENKPVQTLAGKRLLWATATGGDELSFSKGKSNHFTIEEFSAPYQQSARLCGMEWLPPYTLYDAVTLSEPELLKGAEAFRDRIVEEINLLQTKNSGVSNAS